MVERFEAGVSAEVWSHAVSIGAGNLVDVELCGPLTRGEGVGDEPIFQIRAAFDDDSMPETGSVVTIEFGSATAEELATALSELAQADPERFGEVIDE